MLNTNQNRLITSLHNAIEWSLIDMALQSQLFDDLITSTPVEFIAFQHSWCIDKTGHVLDALASLGLLHKNNNFLISFIFKK